MSPTTPYIFLAIACILIALIIWFTRYYSVDAISERRVKGYQFAKETLASSSSTRLGVNTIRNIPKPSKDFSEGAETAITHHIQHHIKCLQNSTNKQWEYDYDKDLFYSTNFVPGFTVFQE